MSRTVLTSLLFAALGAAGVTAYLELGDSQSAAGVCPVRKAYKSRETDAAPAPVRDDYTPAATGPASDGDIVRIAIPAGRSYEEVLATLQRAVRERLSPGFAGSFEVHAFREGDTPAGPPTAGRAACTLAQPEGDEQPFPLLLQVLPGYFDDATMANGEVAKEIVRLRGSDSEVVGLTETPEARDEARVHYRLQAGTKLRILERRAVRPPSGDAFFCYRVQRHARFSFGRPKTGWVHDDRLERRLPPPADR